MLFSEANVRVWLCTEPVDMRKSFNGLSALVKHRLSEDPLSGHLYVFVNRRKTQMKILCAMHTAGAALPSLPISARRRACTRWSAMPGCGSMMIIAANRHWIRSSAKPIITRILCR